MAPAVKNAIVTGGGSGIGRAISLRLAREGMGVGVLDLNQAGAGQVAGEIGASGGRAMAVTADVADAAAVQAAVEQVRAAFGPLTVVVNVAGIGAFVPLAQMTLDDWNRMLAVHLTGTFNGTRAVLPDMVQAGWGRIVNTASVAGLSGGGAGLSHYAAAKGGIIAFTKAIAQELGPAGITANCLAPGLIDTPIITQSLVSAELRAKAIEGAPVRRIGVPDDIAAACSFLVAEEASFITGQVLSPNGGRYM
jgi:2-hydroxycyclohexanecarboxyl-CoA dehydrogenase